MDKKNKKIISWILLLFWMTVIFYMSHQPADISSKQSDFVVYIFNMIGLDFSKFGDLATFIVRKSAHFTEYMILYILSYNLLRFYVKNNMIYIYALIIVFGYASTDEFHQLFVVGRSGQFKDVLIDTSGGTFGILLVYLKNKFSKR